MNKSGWSFALVNNKLSEIFFERNGKIVAFSAYCHVKRTDYKTKKEKAWIEEDIKNIKLKYKNGEFIWINKPVGFTVKTGNIRK